MTRKTHMHFRDGTPLKQVDKATYLVSETSKDAGRWSEPDNRMNIALWTCSKLNTFWFKTDCSYKWKLQVYYNAVIIAQITYGMSIIHFTPAMLHRLDAFQMRGLRHVIKTEHAYYSGTSNKEV